MNETTEGKPPDVWKDIIAAADALPPASRIASFVVSQGFYDALRRNIANGYDLHESEADGVMPECLHNLLNAIPVRVSNFVADKPGWIGLDSKGNIVAMPKKAPEPPPAEPIGDTKKHWRTIYYNSYKKYWVWVVHSPAPYRSERLGRAPTRPAARWQAAQARKAIKAQKREV